MPLTNPGYDMAVVRTAYSTAKSLHASDKVMLALFEAGIVESGFRNLTYGDRDSIGFLQQRPSQGWGTREQIMSPAYATTKFVQAAKPLESHYATAGQLAQAVQRSAFPLKYDSVRVKASELLNSVDIGGGGGDFSSPTTDSNNLFGPFTEIANLATFIGNPHNWLRVAMFSAGVILIAIGLLKLAVSNKTIKSTIKTGAKVGIAKGLI